jgi:hypothetical protein
MADVVNQFEEVLTTYADVKREHPNWSDIAIEDYLAKQRDLVKVADQRTTINVTVQEQSNACQNALLYTLLDRLGSGDALTSDETGFTVDTIELTVDMTEA